MKIIDSSYEILRLDKECDVEMIARGYCICYNTPLPDTYEKQCDLIRKHRKHGSPLEHSIMTVEFTINRGVSHEMVRHRHTAYSQQSTRWCNFSKDRFGNELTFIEDKTIKDSTAYKTWIESLECAEDTYFELLNKGLTTDQARGCLINDLMTKLLVSTNFREWRDIFNLRCDSRAHYQMREVMRPLLEEVINELPCVFDDIVF